MTSTERIALWAVCRRYRDAYRVARARSVKPQSDYHRGRADAFLEARAWLSTALQLQERP